MNLYHRAIRHCREIFGLSWFSMEAHEQARHIGNYEAVLAAHDRAWEMMP